ncbi:Acyl carrier protein [Streptomyces sp. RB5]|uniref:Acyl carrier protein n=1 Tax=Streptomyces smaragdinus TaxID=2585196 RepID=A0A7K0CMR2_9ACTN|nr:acyl carrier protein [Streptomyces smaragdinus]MQY14767.1 Acyl carrier protein [Streptomyces smaragdinus]
MTTSVDERRSDLQALVIKALEGVLGKDLGQATADTKLFEELGLDSTSVLELLMTLEDDHGIEVDPEQLEPEHLQTVGAVCDFIAASQAEA